MNMNHDLLPWGNLDFRKNPYPWYARLQREYPLYRENENTWVITRYKDYMDFVRHPAMTIVEPTWVGPHPWRAIESTVQGVEGAEHVKMRRHSNKWFTPKLVKEWVKHTAEITLSELEHVDADGFLEAHHHLCVMPSHVTMCRVLQIDERDVDRVIQNTLKIVGAQSPLATEANKAVAREGFAFLFEKCRAMIAKKREEPGDGLLDALLAAQDKGEMTEKEVLETLLLFYFSGAPNPAFMLASILHHFTREPELLLMYRDNPEQRQAMINEFIRLYPPEMSFTRFLTEDLQIHGQTIPRGSCLRFITAAVNRDASVFSQPGRFNHLRGEQESQQVSFGIGAHACAGQVITRAEIETVLNIVTERYSRIELAGEPLTLNDDRIRNYLELPVRFIR